MIVILMASPLFNKINIVFVQEQGIVRCFDDLEDAASVIFSDQMAVE